METRRPWDELTRLFTARIASGFGAWVAPGSEHYEAALRFALGRLDEGRQVGEFFLRRLGDRDLRVLDLGAGNGGVSLGIANYRRMELHALDVLVNPELLALRRETSVPMHAAVGVGERLPFADASFDVVLCLETIEHVPDAPGLAREILRVLTPGGQCMVTTPARVRYWFRRDPHYDIPGLLLLPDGLQRWVATRVLRRVEHYDVQHIYWHTSEIARLFRGATRFEGFWNYDYGGSLGDKIAHVFRKFFWDRLVIVK